MWSSSFVFCLCLLALGHSSRVSLTMSSKMGRNLYIKVDGNDLCYDLLSSQSQQGSGPPIVYLPGLIRQKSDAKSINLQSFCKKSDFTYFCADYVGVGRSKGKFTDGSVGKWADDTIYMIEKVVGNLQGKVLLVGHGVGSWIAFVIAKKRPDLVSGIVGLAADPDFTEELLWKKLDENIKKKIMDVGEAEISWGNEKYIISKSLIEDGRKNLLLTSNRIDVSCPVRLIHGLQDEEVPYQLAMQLIDKCKTSDASLMLLKSSAHSMDSEGDMKAMRSMIIDVMNAFKGDFDLKSPASG